MLCLNFYLLWYNAVLLFLTCHAQYYTHDHEKTCASFCTKLLLDYCITKVFYEDCFKTFPIMLALCLMISESDTYYAQNVTRHDKIRLMCTKYTISNHSIYLIFCVRYTRSVNCIKYAIVCYTSCESYIDKLRMFRHKVMKLWSPKKWSNFMCT